MSGTSPGDFSRVGFVTGLRQEARVCARLGGLVEIGGGTYAGALLAARRVADRGATALVSFGVAGGLDPALRPGMVIIARYVYCGVGSGCRRETDAALRAALGEGSPCAWTLLGASTAVATARDKRRIHAETGCALVDMETGAVAEVAAERGLPFAAVRAICDPAERDLPPAASLPLTRRGSIDLRAVLVSVARRPAQIPELARLARDAVAARQALVALTRRLGPS